MLFRNIVPINQQRNNTFIELKVSPKVFKGGEDESELG